MMVVDVGANGGRGDRGGGVFWVLAIAGFVAAQFGFLEG